VTSRAAAIVLFGALLMQPASRSPTRIEQRVTDLLASFRGTMGENGAVVMGARVSRIIYDHSSHAANRPI
jgi:hypothetical protein